MSKAFRIANAFMGIVFVICVALQWNDPDPYVWMPLYGAAALACLLFAASRLRPWMSVLLAVVALVWAFTIWPRIAGKVHFADMFESMQAKGSVEEERELGGLLIVAFWMAALTIASLRRAKARSTS